MPEKNLVAPLSNNGLSNNGPPAGDPPGEGPPSVPLVAVVDDDGGVRGSLDSLLRSAGMAGIGFARAEDLLSSPLRHRIGCVVTDLHMPGMTGLELQAELARQGWPQPVILMTAYPTDAARAQAIAGGARAFLTKPIDPDALLAAVEAVLR